MNFNVLCLLLVAHVAFAASPPVQRNARSPSPAMPVNNLGPSPAMPVNNLGPSPALPVNNLGPSPALPVNNLRPSAALPVNNLVNEPVLNVPAKKTWRQRLWPFRQRARPAAPRTKRFEDPYRRSQSERIYLGLLNGNQIKALAKTAAIGVGTVMGASAAIGAVHGGIQSARDKPDGRERSGEEKGRLVGAGVVMGAIRGMTLGIPTPLTNVAGHAAAAGILGLKGEDMNLALKAGLLSGGTGMVTIVPLARSTVSGATTAGVLGVSPGRSVAHLVGVGSDLDALAQFTDKTELAQRKTSIRQRLKST